MHCGSKRWHMYRKPDGNLLDPSPSWQDYIPMPLFVFCMVSRNAQAPDRLSCSSALLVTNCLVSGIVCG